MHFKWAGLSVLLFLMLACSDGTESTKDYKNISIQEQSSDIELPKVFWDELESFTRNRRPDVPIENISVRFFPINALFEEKNSGVLIDKYVRWIFPQGGGSVDFSKLLTGQIGTFRLKFELPVQYSPEDLRVYYYSRAKKRRIDNEIWGSGCKTLLDVTDYVTSDLMSGNGVELNTHRNRHLSVVGGDFIFVIRSSSETMVSRVSFEDSNNSAYLCQDARKR